MIPSWLWNLPLSTIARSAEEHGLSREMVASLVMAESSGDPYAVRYEPVYKWLYKPRDFAENLNITVITEEAYQRCSFGLMQIMGANCREMGFHESLIIMANNEKLSLDYGCRFLKGLLDRYGNYQDAVSAYNQGSPRKKNGLYENHRYVTKVMNFYREITKLN